jgi:hypothetical protein
MDQGEVYFLKMNNGEDLLVQLVGDEEDCLWVTQPYRVELIPSATSMTVVTSIMRWIPFESLMDEKVRIIKTNILTYLAVDDIVADSYLNTISEQAKEERVRAREQQKKLVRTRAITANTSGSFH